ncbi:DUF2730 family protein [Phaeobacter sp. 11ANDIMAR09]|uniref:DUF2730 family protein n=1 Tax=Phaeobacter sp. 11ANDIMAR09 TaxID=1225647 RepID=UPI0006C8A0B5|nr:DUF2730 family protein [Phaeobacter sp. 11ANDIMAR09]KPD10878.1 hypothetical protein AN476_18675 [Phaeobacter sp. 11ANDIMAR09]
MALDLETGLKLASLLLSIGAIIFTWFATRRKDVDLRFDVGSKRMDQHDLEIQALQQTVAALPAKEDMHRMELAMSDVSGELKAIGAHMAGQRDVMRRIENVVTRHEEHLLSGSPKK